MGKILDMAIADARKIINNGGFELELTITPNNHEPIVVKGLATRHSENFDTDGLPKIATNAHCTFCEKDVNDLGVTTRDSNGNVSVKGWLISWTDAIATYNYTMSEPAPDNTLGLIRVQLTNNDIN